jgi:hypothetical protein
VRDSDSESGEPGGPGTTALLSMPRSCRSRILVPAAYVGFDGTLGLREVETLSEGRLGALEETLGAASS